MAHFAKIENNIVVEVLTINNTDCGWLQTSYHANFRANYAGIQFIYDADLDESYRQQTSRNDKQKN
jgi:hypothetical protein